MTRDSAVVALSDSAILSAWEQGTAAAAVERPLILLHHAGRAVGPGPGRGGGAPGGSRSPLAASRTGPGAAGSRRALVLDEGRGVSFRLRTPADLRNASQCRSDEDGARLLAAGCLLESWSADDTPLADSMIDALGSAMAERDPQSDVSLEARCPACEAELAVNFDVADYVWRRVP